MVVGKHPGVGVGKHPAVVVDRLPVGVGRPPVGVGRPPVVVGRLLVGRKAGLGSLVCRPVELQTSRN